MNLYSIIFLFVSFASASILLLLYYGASRYTHRLTTAGSFYFMSIVISSLVCVMVVEACAINELVPKLRAMLKREGVAVAAQMAFHDTYRRDTRHPMREADMSERLRSAHRLITDVEQYIRLEEEESNPVEVFLKLNASPAAVTFVVSSLLSVLLISMQRAFAMMESEGWSYNGPSGAFVMDPAAVAAELSMQ